MAVTNSEMGFYITSYYDEHKAIVTDVNPDSCTPFRVISNSARRLLTELFAKDLVTHKKVAGIEYFPVKLGIGIQKAQVLHLFENGIYPKTSKDILKLMLPHLLANVAGEKSLVVSRVDRRTKSSFNVASQLDSVMFVEEMDEHTEASFTWTQSYGEPILISSSPLSK